MPGPRARRLRRHQVDLLAPAAVLEPSRPAGDPRRHLDRHESELPVEGDARFERRGLELQRHVMDRGHGVSVAEIADRGSPRAGGEGPGGQADACEITAEQPRAAILSGAISANCGISCPKVVRAVRISGKNEISRGERAGKPSASRVSFDHSYHLEGGRK
jgi:hypothetical protein